MPEQFISASSVHSYGTSFRDNGYSTIPKKKCLERDHSSITAVFYGMICPIVLRSCNDTNNLKWQIKVTSEFII